MFTQKKIKTENMASFDGGVNVLNYEGCNFFKQRIILATLSGKSVKFSKIRQSDINPGFAGFEVNLMNLVEKVSKGSTIRFSECSTKLYYQPGMLNGGKFDHDCDLERPIGYYLELLLCLAPFMKVPLNARLRGVTNSQTDPSVDVILCSGIPLLEKFLGTDEGLELKIIKRGTAPEGGGEVLFKCPVRQKLRPIQFTDSGKIKRIRGISWTTRVTPAIGKRMTEAAREILGKCLSDLYIESDHRKGPQAGKSPGFGIVLVAETINGAFLCAESMAHPRGSTEPASLPEDVAREAAILLLNEISKGGCVDSTSQSLGCLLMTLGDKDVSKLLSGSLTNYTVHFLRHLRDFFGVTFKIDVQELEDQQIGQEKILLTCTGIGFRNLSKAVI